MTDPAQLPAAQLEGLGRHHTVRIALAVLVDGDRSLGTMIKIAEAVLAEGLASEAEVKETIAGLRAYTEDAESIVACPGVFQVRGHNRAIEHQGRPGWRVRSAPSADHGCGSSPMTSTPKEPVMPNPLSPDPKLRPTSVPSPRRSPARPAAWIYARQARVAGLLLFAALAGAGCSDQTAPTPPDAADAPVSGGAADAKRTTFISDLQLPSNVLYVDLSGTHVRVNYELTNPGGKTSGLHIEGQLRQGSYNNSSGYSMIDCGGTAGTIGHGTCRSSILLEIPSAGFQYGPAQFTLTLSKLVNNVVTSIDRRTVDVFIIPI